MNQVGLLMCRWACHESGGPEMTHVFLLIFKWAWPVWGHMTVVDSNKPVESICCVILGQNRALICSVNSDLNACKIRIPHASYLSGRGQ